MAVETERMFTLGRYPKASFPSRLRLTVTASIESVAPAVDQAVNFAADHGCVGESEFEIRLALHEALANAVLHGCKQDGSKRVECLIACDERELLVIVRDPGKGFNPDKLPDPTDDDCLLKANGRGVELMRRLMDEVHFERGGAEVHMIKRHSSDGTPASDKQPS